MTNYLLKKASELTSENSDFRLTGFSGIAAANQLTYIEWKLPQERWISGGTFFAIDGKWGDLASMYVVVKSEDHEDITDIFVENLAIPGTNYFEYVLDVPYISLISKDYYVRIAYDNKDALNQVKVGMNLMTHIPTDIT